MTSGTGLGASLAFGLESSPWGTAVTPTKFPEVISESPIKLDKTFLQGLGLRGGGYMPRSAQNKEVKRQVTGGWSMNVFTKGMGLLWQACVGSYGQANATPALLVTPAYKAIHQVGVTDGYGLTVQMGRPQTDGTVKPFTYSGCKIVAWELTISAGGLHTLNLTIDGKDGVTATALTTYTPIAGNELFSFVDTTVFKLGGTASTTSNVVSVASGVQVTSVVKELKFTGTRGSATDRFGVGFGGVKAEQVNNAWGDIKIALTTEFNSQAEFYDRYTAGTVLPLQCTSIGSAIGASGSNNTLDIIASACKVTSTDITAAGPDILQSTVMMEVLDDGANSPFQLTTISADSAL